uniref:Pecanex-like protein n=1 Tax=Heterorhabditis bacteriophora TaxID=37862 RepID=A0A1I7WL76_HETBA
MQIPDYNYVNSSYQFSQIVSQTLSVSISMVSTCVSSPKMSGDPLGVNFNIIKQISPSPTSPQEHENVKDSLQSNSPGLDLSISMDCSEVTVASAVSSEKARIRQQSAMLDKWLMANGGNLYPCPVQMKMTYIQVSINVFDNSVFGNGILKQILCTIVFSFSRFCYVSHPL